MNATYLDAPTLPELATGLLEHQRDEWDLDPSLGLVFQEPTWLRAYGLATPPWLWRGASFTRALGVARDALVRSWAELDPQRTMEPPAGCWVVCESWGAPPDRVEELSARRRAGGSIPTIDESMPGAIERREALLVDRDGLVTWAFWERVSGRREVITSVAPDAVNGGVADALRSMAVALTAL